MTHSHSSPSGPEKAPAITPAYRKKMIDEGGWRNVLLNDLFASHVARTPNKIAIVSHNADTNKVTRVTLSGLDTAATRIAAKLAGLGIQRGDVVAFQLNNRWEFLAIALACARVGAVANALMPILRQRELRFMLGISQAKVFLVPAAFRGYDYLSMANELRNDIPTLQHVFALGTDGPDESNFDRHFLTAVSPLLGSAASSTLRPDDVCQLLFTSGTTGEAKGVMHTSNTLLGHVLPFTERMKLTGDDVFMSPTPLAHQLGYLYGVLAPLALGAKVVLQDVWNPGVAAELIAAEGATLVMGATPFLVDLANLEEAPQGTFKSLRYFVSGGAPIPPAVVHKAQDRLGGKVISVWGMTECSAVTTVKPEDPADQSAVSDGVAMPYTAVKVFDEAGKTCAPGVEGRLFTRGASLCVGYFMRPELFQLDEEGWFDTGDLAKMDESGYIRITGRAKDMIIRGGENVPVVEIESLLFQHPSVAVASIVAMPHPRLGEIGCAYVVPKSGSVPTLKTLTSFLHERQVSRSYWPEQLVVVDSLPMTASGKVQKFELRERAKSLAAAEQEAKAQE